LTAQTEDKLDENRVCLQFFLACTNLDLIGT